MPHATAAHPPVTDHPTSVTNVPFEPIVGAHLEHTAEPQPVRWTFAAFDVAAAWTTSWLDYTTSLLQRRATCVDVLKDARRFWSVAAARPRPTWSTPFRVVTEWPAARLLDFSTEPDADVVPTLILPPQAGHASTIVDYTPEQSQVRTALNQGLTRLFVLEWLGATPQTQDATIEDYLAIMDEAVQQVGGTVHLVGDCQGGWLATIYAALRPGSVASLSIGAAPIDFHAGSGAIYDWVSAQSATDDPMQTYRSLVAANGGVHRGDLQVTGFKMLEPAGELSRLADLWANIGDEDYTQRYLDFVAWFETPQDMPGAFYLWVVEHLFVNNELVAGTLQVGGETVDLSRITMPVHLLAGTNDHITPPEQVWALARHISTPAEDVSSQFVEAGHLGLFMGRRALTEHWAPLFRDVRTRDAASRTASEEPTAPALPVEQDSAPAAKLPVETAPADEDPNASAPAKAAPAPVTKAPAPVRAARARARKASAPAKITSAPAKTAPAPVKTTPAPADMAPAPAAVTAPAEKAPAPAKVTAPADKAPAPAKVTPAPADKAPAPATPAPADKAPATPAPADKALAPAKVTPAPADKAPATPAPADKAPATPAPADKAPAPAKATPAPADQAPAKKAPARKTAPRRRPGTTQA